MLLKDFECEVLGHGVFMAANVIIKREGKFYSVHQRMAAQPEGDQEMEPGYINEAIQQFLEHCLKVDGEWKVSRLDTLNNERLIFEHEIKL